MASGDKRMVAKTFGGLNAIGDSHDVPFGQFVRCRNAVTRQDRGYVETRPGFDPIDGIFQRPCNIGEINWTSTTTPVIPKPPEPQTGTLTLTANPKIVVPYQTITFVVNGGGEDDLDIDTYTWDFDYDGEDDSDATGAETSQEHYYTDTGYYRIRVWGTAADGEEYYAYTRVRVMSEASHDEKPTVDLKVDGGAGASDGPVNIAAADNVTASWEVENADWLIIRVGSDEDEGTRYDPTVDGSATIAITEGTVISAEVGNSKGGDDDSVTVTVGGVPVTADDPTIVLTIDDQDGPVTLPEPRYVNVKWVSTNAVVVFINGSPAAETSGQTSQPVSHSQTFFASAYNSIGEVATDEVRVNVESGSPPSWPTWPFTPTNPPSPPPVVPPGTTTPPGGSTPTPPSYEAPWIEVHPSLQSIEYGETAYIEYRSGNASTISIESPDESSSSLTTPAGLTNVTPDGDGLYSYSFVAANADGDTAIASASVYVSPEDVPLADPEPAVIGLTLNQTTQTELGVERYIIPSGADFTVTATLYGYALDGSTRLQAIPFPTGTAPVLSIERCDAAVTNDFSSIVWTENADDTYTGTGATITLPETDSLAYGKTTARIAGYTGLPVVCLPFKCYQPAVDVNITVVDAGGTRLESVDGTYNTLTGLLTYTVYLKLATVETGTSTPIATIPTDLLLSWEVDDGWPDDASVAFVEVVSEDAFEDGTTVATIHGDIVPRAFINNGDAGYASVKVSVTFAATEDYEEEHYLQLAFSALENL